jgi:hypothetical protein
MASVVVNGDTSGAVTLSAPAVAGTVTVTLPATSGTMLTTASSTGISGSAISSGTVLEAYGGTGTSTGYYGFKNRIINGAMVIDQRYAGTATANTINGYNIDRFQIVQTVTGKLIAQQNAGSVTPPAGFVKYQGVTSQSAYSVLAGDYYLIQQAIEGLNVTDLAWGTASAATVTLSFWVRSSLTGTFGGSLRNSASSRSYPFSYTISLANTWEQKSITIVGDTTGTWLTDTGTGIWLAIGLGVGTTYSGTAGAWAGSAYFSATGATSVVGTNGATFYITGVQLEKGSTATSFDYRPYGTELDLCQRYCKVYRSSDSSNGYTRLGYGPAESATTTVTQCPITTQMRTSPSITTTGTFIFYDGVTITNVTSIVINAAQTPYLICLSPVAASGLTATRAYELATNTGGSGVAIFSAEL